MRLRAHGAVYFLQKPISPCRSFHIFYTMTIVINQQVRNLTESNTFK